MIPLWCIPIATVTGNCLVMKPSERDPGAAMILAELAKEAGFPPGVINIVHGSAPTVDFILDEPAIKAISFVGSNRAGEYIYTRGSANGKRVQANLGAKNHAAVLPDCNKNHVSQRYCWCRLWCCRTALHGFEHLRYGWRDQGVAARDR